MKNPSPTSPTPAYEPPRILQKGQLKHFAGSPLLNAPTDPDDILGLPTR